MLDPTKPSTKPYCEEVLDALVSVEEQCKVVIDKGNGGRKLATCILKRLNSIRTRNEEHRDQGTCDETA